MCCVIMIYPIFIVIIKGTFDNSFQLRFERCSLYCSFFPFYIENEKIKQIENIFEISNK